MWAISVITQTAGSILVAYRELSTPVHVPSKAPRYCTVSSAACAIIDSGAAYTLGIILTLAFYTREHAEGAVVVAILGQISVRAARSRWLCMRRLTFQGDCPVVNYCARMVEGRYGSPSSGRTSSTERAHWGEP
ncbi:hypothetical protein PENSPDRAFT_659426 [Peniophora sp. CONT]|nr:hypothetical protein PENSPDRAFT_659426 [Peniophora sp. CONT]